MAAKIIHALLALSSLAVLSVNAQAPGVPVVIAKPYINANSSHFGLGIEGASIDQAGNVYAVDWGTAATGYTIGQIYPKQKLVYSNPNKIALYKGIRWLKTPSRPSNVERQALLVDTQLGISRLTIFKNGVQKLETVCTHPNLTLANDCAISDTGDIFISQQIWNDQTVIGDGGVWHCHQNDVNATAVPLFIGGRTNGIEVSPDDKTLYVSEAFNVAGLGPVSNILWHFTITKTKTGPKLTNKRVFVDFAKLDNTASVDIDGSRTDIDGNLYVTRNGGGGVYKFAPNGKPLLFIKTNFPTPANLELAGKDGKTMYIIGPCDGSNGVDKGCANQYRARLPGKAWSKLRAY
ncbi:hypothetical protein BC936DRAFT_146595 [Jimgerdemannia flammicorona]|uniref:SMP-30/Gluconolactonase/LRE-like region domain-containing protein n=1 Tax=Jimgerdemannia flammicorona TaxID=994334 RepID=A0A433D780_9FUNG|nr:hypothetical protein BC936DRAFT_146595 [Jimgerdemannia flammicorona]